MSAPPYWVIKLGSLYLDVMGGPTPPGETPTVRWVCDRADATPYSVRGYAWEHTLKHGGRVVTVRRRARLSLASVAYNAAVTNLRATIQDMLNVPGMPREAFNIGADALGWARQHDVLVKP